MVKARRGVPEARRAIVEKVECRWGEIEGEKLVPTSKRFFFFFSFFYIMRSLFLGTRSFVQR